jgi:hypothetical protein
VPCLGKTTPGHKPHIPTSDYSQFHAESPLWKKSIPSFTIARNDSRRFPRATKAFSFSLLCERLLIEILSTDPAPESMASHLPRLPVLRGAGVSPEILQRDAA